jgi:PAS domain-containing protein
MEERRRHPSPTSPKGYLDHLPASQLLNRLPTAILGIGLLGDIAYANPACAEMFGYVGVDGYPPIPARVDDWTRSIRAR